MSAVTILPSQEESLQGSLVEWANQTNVHPVGLIVVVLLGMATLLVSRRWAVLPMMAVMCLIPSGQRIVVEGLDFNFIRIMIIFGWFRLLIRGECGGFRWRWLDSMLVGWAVSSTVIYTLQWGTSSSFINRLGASFDALGGYFLFRCLLRSSADITRLAVGVAGAACVVAVFFVVEKATGRNLFAVFGGVPEITAIRQGKLRCQGAFSHPILAGCYWAALVPIIGSLWWSAYRWRWWSVAGVCATLAIVFLCASSTPVLAMLAAVLGGAAFVIRGHLRWIRWGTVAALVGLHMAMNHPVWHLIGRINLVGGSTGWHRYHLIDAAIRNVGEWAILGVKSTGHWGYGLSDVTNQYVVEGIRGGALTLLLFLCTLGLAFRCVGQAWRRASRTVELTALCWGIGVSLLVHSVSFISVSYFGQSTMLWYLTLALAATIADLAASERPRNERVIDSWG